MISPDVIDRIRERTSLAEVVGQSMKLERKGRTFVGLCPFHKEKSPSFNVNDERGFYHCFGCHASGDVFKFVQAIEGLSFIEAVRQLGERAGVEVTDDLTDAERKQRFAQKRREDDLYQVSALAASYFEKMLGEHRHAQLAHAELQKRQLPYDGPASEVLRGFRVGYAPDGWDGLAEHLKSHGADLRAAEAVGLLAQRKQGNGYYDRFRQRLMFAVIDLQGRVVAFSGRALPPPVPLEAGAEAPAKYINSPESPIYRKRETVFGLYQARTALRSGPCLLVEGNFDVVSLHARGFPSAVAPLGTAFTVEQGKQIRRFTSEVVFLFDGDGAGRKAVGASRGACRDSGLGARVASLPDGMDPDDFSRNRGQEALGQMLGAALPMLDYLVKEVLDRPFSEHDAPARAKEVRDLLASENDPIVRLRIKTYADTFARQFRVADARTSGAVDRAIFLGEPSPDATDRERAPGLPNQTPARQQSREQAKDIANAVLGALLDYPQLLDSEHLLAYSESLQGDLAVTVAVLRRAYSSLVDKSPVNNERSSRLGVTFEAALAKVPEAVRPFATARLAAPLYSDLEQAQIVLISNLKKMQNQDFSRQKVGNIGDLARARSEGDQHTEFEILRALELRARQRRGL